MKNFLKKIWIELSNHNRYKMLSAIVCTGLLLWFHGCQIKTRSISDPNKLLTVPELQAEIDSFYAEQENDAAKFEALARARAADVNEQIAFRKFVYESALTVATNGGLDWFNLLASAGTLIGAGAVADNIRYRIKNPQKNT